MAESPYRPAHDVVRDVLEEVYWRMHGLSTSNLDSDTELFLDLLRGRGWGPCRVPGRPTPNDHYVAEGQS